MSLCPVRPWVLSPRLTMSLPQHRSPGTQDGFHESSCCLNEWQWLLRWCSSRKIAPVRVRGEEQRPARCKIAGQEDPWRQGMRSIGRSGQEGA